MNGRHGSTWEPGVAGFCRALLGTDASGRGCFTPSRAVCPHALDLAAFLCHRLLASAWLTLHLARRRRMIQKT